MCAHVVVVGPLLLLPTHAIVSCSFLFISVVCRLSRSKLFLFLFVSARRQVETLP